MIIEKKTIGGREGIVAYLTRDLEPASSRESAGCLKVHFDDGAVEYLFRMQEPRPQGRIARRMSTHKEQ